MRLVRRAQDLMREYDKVQGEATMDTLRRFRVLLMASVPLHTLLAGWFARYRAPVDQPGLQHWADALTLLQAGLTAALLVFGLVANHLLQRQNGDGRVALGLQTAFCTTYLAFGAAAAILDVGVGNGIATFLIICMGTAVLSLMHPVVSALLFGGAWLIFWSILKTASVDATLLSSLQIQAVSATLMAQMISMMMWHQYSRRVVLSRQLAVTHEALLAKQHELEMLAERDTLTGLYNRRKFMQLAEQELGRVSRIPGNTCLLMVDLDHFKRINDQYGHPVGDEVLQQVAAILTGGVRATDVVARIGGEEFIVLMPNTPLAGAVALAEKLRNALRSRPLEILERLVPVTASIGVTGVEPHQRASIDALYAAADQALYAAKRMGRDRVECAEPIVQAQLLGSSTDGRI